MAAFEDFFVTIKSQSIELTYMYEYPIFLAFQYPIYSMFLPETNFFGTSLTFNNSEAFLFLSGTTILMLWE
jgi:hypothetical protein